MKTIFLLLYGLTFFLAPLTTANPVMVAPVTEIWRVGFLVEQPPSLTGLNGRMAMAAAALQTAQDPVDTYFAFPAKAGDRWVTDAKFNLLARSGAYSGELQMTLAVYDPEGSLKRVVSQGTIDLQTVPQSGWTTVALSNPSGDRLVSAGEILAFHFAMTDGQAGDLVVQSIFEVTVKNVIERQYLPFISL